MRRNFIVLMTLFAAIIVTAQNDTKQKYLLTTNVATFGMSSQSMLDPYLSPMTYSGVSFSYNKENRRFFNTANTNYSMQSKLALSAGLMLNPAITSEMSYFGVNYGWGVNYHFRMARGLRILAGGLWDVNFGFKDVPRNINNPVNLDMATNLNLTGLIMYDYQTRKNTLHFQLALQTPIIGYMFVPESGASYYDMFRLGNLSDTFHFSSLINKRGLSQTYTVDVPFKTSTWRFGLHFLDLKYKANELVFAHHEVSLVIGKTFDGISFAGKKKKAPEGFISTND